MFNAQRYPLKHCLPKKMEFFFFLLVFCVLFLKIYYFQMRFLLKSDLRVSIATATMEKIVRIKHFLISKNCDIFHINDDIIIKVYKVPL